MRSSLLAIAGTCAMLVNAQDAKPAVDTLEQFQAALEGCLGQCHADEQNCQQQCINTLGHGKRETVAGLFGREVVTWSGGITCSLPKIRGLGIQSAILIAHSGVSLQRFVATGVWETLSDLIQLNQSTPAQVSTSWPQIHNPSGDNIIAIQNCQYGCVQGDGSYEQNNLFMVCIAACSRSNGTSRGPFMGDVVVSTSSANLSSTAPVSATGTTTTTTLVAASNTAIGTSIGSSKTSSSPVSATASSTASGVGTGDAGESVRIGMGGLGLFGLVAAFFM